MHCQPRSSPAPPERPEPLVIYFSRITRTQQRNEATHTLLQTTLWTRPIFNRFYRSHDRPIQTQRGCCRVPAAYTCHPGLREVSEEKVQGSSSISNVYTSPHQLHIVCAFHSATASIPASVVLPAGSGASTPQSGRLVAVCGSTPASPQSKLRPLRPPRTTMR